MRSQKRTRPNSSLVAAFATCIVLVAGTMASPILASTTTESVRDELSSGTWTDNDGTVDWSGPWQENDTQSGGDGPIAGQVRIKNGKLRLDDRPNTGGQPSAAREVDLTGALSTTISFDFQTSSGVDTGDWVSFDISVDGGGSKHLFRALPASPWHSPPGSSAYR